MTEDFKERLARLEAKNGGNTPSPPDEGFGGPGASGPGGPRGNRTITMVFGLLAAILLPTVIAIGFVVFKQSPAGQELAESIRNDAPEEVAERVSVGLATGVWTRGQAEAKMRAQMGDRHFEGWLAQAEKGRQTELDR